MPIKSFTKVKKCITKNCNEISKKLTRYIRLYKNKLNSKCKNTKNNKNYTKCSLKYYKHPENKEYRNIFNEYEKCNKNKCSKEINELYKKK